MEDDTEIDDFLRNNTRSESGHDNEVSKIDLQLKLQVVAKCASLFRIRIEFDLFQFNILSTLCNRENHSSSIDNFDCKQWFLPRQNNILLTTVIAV